MVDKRSNFQQQLEGKESANFILSILFGVVTIGLVLYCLITQSFSPSFGPLYFLILLFGSLTTFFIVLLKKIKKYKQHPENFVVYDSFVVDKKTEQSRYQYCYYLLVKKENGKPFKLMVDPQDYNAYRKNSKILAIKDPLLGGFLISEEDCDKYGFKRISVERENGLSTTN